MTWLPGRAGNRQSAVADAQAIKEELRFSFPRNLPYRRQFPVMQPLPSLLGEPTLRR
jgi:hypothetical protein